MKKIQWLIQENLTGEDILNALYAACDKNDVHHETVTIVPFSDELPDFDHDRINIVYGSTTFMNNIYTDEDLRAGLFYDPLTFSMENYLNRWGEHMLNYGAKITTFKEFSLEDHRPEELFFIRPDADSKSFDGEVKEFGEVRKWFKKLNIYDNVDLTVDTKILVCEPWNIKKEWRIYVVEGEPITGSQYRNNFRISKSKDVPDEVYDFVKKMCKEYTPHDVFVMDVCECSDELYMIECGCMNSAGFYLSDIDTIVRVVTEYVKRQNS